MKSPETLTAQPQVGLEKIGNWLRHPATFSAVVAGVLLGLIIGKFLGIVGPAD